MNSIPWKPKGKQIIADALPELGALHTVLIVHCWAEWNMIDRQMDALLQELHKQYHSSIHFRALDCDAGSNWAFLKEAKVLNLPALVCFINGNRYETLIGMRAKEMLITKFEEWLSLAQL